MIDNTFATPVNFRPIEHGFDLVPAQRDEVPERSLGHRRRRASPGARELVERVQPQAEPPRRLLDPHACFLLHRGLKTLALRVRHQNESALDDRAVPRGASGGRAACTIPGSRATPRTRGHASCSTGFGGVLSFELKGGARGGAAVVPAPELAVVRRAWAVRRRSSRVRP